MKDLIGKWLRSGNVFQSDQISFFKNFENYGILYLEIRDFSRAENQWLIPEHIEYKFDLIKYIFYFSNFILIAKYNWEKITILLKCHI